MRGARQLAIGLVAGVLSFSLSSGLGAQVGSRDGPDLIVESLELQPPEPEPDQQTVIRAVVANVGRGDVTERFRVLFEVDGQRLAAPLVTFGLRRGRRRTLEVPWTATEGEHLIRVRADAPFNRVSEADERNNERTLAVIVRPPTAVRLITSGALGRSAGALAQAGAAFVFEPSPDLFQSFSQAQQRLAAAIPPLAGASTAIEQRLASLPVPLADEPQVPQLGQLARWLAELQNAFHQALETLQVVNLRGTLEAFLTVRTVLTAWAAFSVEGFSFAALETALPPLERLLGLLAELNEALAGRSARDPGEVANELFQALSGFGEALQQAGEAPAREAAARAPQVRDADGQSDFRHYRGGDLLQIQVEGAQALQFEVFDAAGQPVAQVRTEGDRLAWRGTDAQEVPLPAGTYYFRLVIISSEGGNRRVELGELLLAEGP